MIVFNKKMMRNWIATCKRMNVGQPLVLFTKMDPRPKHKSSIHNFLEKIQRIVFMTLDIVNDFLDMTEKHNK